MLGNKLIVSFLQPLLPTRKGLLYQKLWKGFTGNFLLRVAHVPDAMEVDILEPGELHSV